MGRWDVLRRIEALDPHRDFREVYRLSATYEFPWDMTQALSLALFRTYAVPSIGRLLARTGESTDRAQKRYEDTGLLSTPSSSTGRTASPDARRYGGSTRCTAPTTSRRRTCATS